MCRLTANVTLPYWKTQPTKPGMRHSVTNVRHSGNASGSSEHCQTKLNHPPGQYLPGKPRTERQSDKRKKKRTCFEHLNGLIWAPPGLRDALLSVANSK